MLSRSLTSKLTRERLLRLAGDRAFDRGERYMQEARVGEIVEDGDSLVASVHGEMRYRTILTIGRSGITGSCTCPVGDEGTFCKHCVAVGLRWLATDVPAPPTPARRAKQGARTGNRSAPERSITMKDVRAHLATLPSATLVELVVQHALEDEELRQRLVLDVAKAASTGVKLHTYRQAISNAIGMGGRFIDYREAASYFLQIHAVISSIEALRDTEPLAVIELVEHALQLLERAMGHVDDSDGNAAEVLDRLHALHLAACTLSRPDPEALAERLFERERNSDWEIFRDSATRYASVLGAKGIARFRALADDEWRKFPAIGVGEQRRAFSGERFRIASIMESLARLTGDVDAIADVKARDLSSAYSYLEIAELYHESGRADLAIDWAERGRAAFPDQTDWRLRSFLATQYHRQGRLPDAMALLWLNFVDRPSLPEYAALHEMAAPVGQWRTWRSRAMDHVRHAMVTPAEKSPSGAGASRVRGTDASLMVELLLWEEDTEGAWREAKGANCRADLWMRLAELRELSHPNDSVQVYQAEVERTLAHARNSAYREAVSMLRDIARVMKRSSASGGFAAYLASVRARHKAKRNFMKLIDAARL